MGEKKVQEYFVFSVTALKVTKKKREREKERNVYTFLHSSRVCMGRNKDSSD